jgi:salicylate hydroxylase
MNPTNQRIGIIGAGTSGVFLASLLIEQGFQVTLFEKAAYPRTEGCGILIVPSGMNILHQGNPAIFQQILTAGVPVQKYEFRNLRGGIINSEPAATAPEQAPALLVNRKDILTALVTAVPPDILVTNAHLQSVTQTDREVTAHFRDGRQWTGDLLVGADGILSKVRDFVVPGVELCYLGDLVWRGVVADESFCPPGNFIVYTRGRGIYANFFDLGRDPQQPNSPKRTHWGFFMEQEQAEHQQLLCPADPTIPATALAKLPADARAIIESTPPEAIVTRYSYDIDTLPHLHQGRVLLIGDAAHAKSPTRAKGMTSGWEDALALTQHLSAGLGIPETLVAYESERLPIVHEYQRSSREMSRRIGRKQKRAA